MVLGAVLATEIEMDVATALDLHMAVSKCGYAIAFVGLGIFLVAHPHQRRLEEPYDRRQHLLARYAGARQVLFHPRPDLRQCLAEEKHLSVFSFITHFAPARMVAILFAATCIASDRLEVAVRSRTDPHFFVCRWDRQLADTGQRLFIDDPAPVRMAIRKTCVCTNAPHVRLSVIDVSQSGNLRRGLQADEIRCGKRRDQFGHFRSFRWGGKGNTTSVPRFRACIMTFWCPDSGQSVPVHDEVGCCL